MPLILTSDSDVQLYVSTDPYFWTTDNRPLRRLIKNDQALNAAIEEILDGDMIVVPFIVESPSVEDMVGGIFYPYEDGEIVRVTVSVGTSGSSDDFLIDVMKGTGSGESIYSSPANRPSLAYDSVSQVVESLSPNIDNGSVSANQRVWVNVETIQGGTPRWLRVNLWIKPDRTEFDALDF